MDKVKGQKTRRKLVQALSALAMNGHLVGFITGQIYQGPLKKFCVPGMNCYSCPGALGACPIGSLQNFLGHGKTPRFLLKNYIIPGIIKITGFPPPCGGHCAARPGTSGRPCGV